MINPAGIPVIPGDMTALTAHARTISTTGTAFAATGQTIHTTWQGLRGVYQAPEAEQLFTATAPIRSVTATVGADLDAAGTALSTYAAEVVVPGPDGTAGRRRIRMSGGIVGITRSRRAFPSSIPPDQVLEEWPPILPR